MAFLTPAIRDENSHIHIEKDPDALMVALPLPAKAGRQDHKALKDLSNTGKSLISGPSKALKDLTNTDKHQIFGPSKRSTLKEKNMPAKAGRQDRKALKDLSNTGKPLTSSPSKALKDLTNTDKHQISGPSKTSTLKGKNMPAKAGRQDRKALKDLSNTGKPLTSGPSKALKDLTNTGKHQVSGPSKASKASTLKEKNVLRGRETVKNSVKSNFLTDEQLKRCHEWAEEGIERAHFLTESEEERIHKLEAMSYLDELLSPLFELKMSKEELYEDSSDLEMELEIEELPFVTKSQISGGKEIDDLLEPEDDDLWFLVQPFELKLEPKEED